MGKNKYQIKALIAPLDWGLGHTTRSIVLLKALQEADIEVVMAGSPNQITIWSKEYPDVLKFPLKGYNVHYTKRKIFLPLAIISQIPKILFRIYQEHHWLKKIVAKENIQLIISDNRFGLWHKSTHCIFITHQLEIKASSSFLQSWVQRINYFFINKYAACWVPDYAGEKNIAGTLSHPEKLPKIPVHYIGPLSRCKQRDPIAPTFDYLFLLSGPEPQRTLLENKFRDALEKLSGKSILLLGKPGTASVSTTHPNYTTFNHLETTSLEKYMQEAEWIICRAGYTTIMEILALKKKAILIPTPGQTEQEFLGAHLANQKWCICIDQEDDLLTAVENAKTFDFQFPDFPEGTLQQEIEKLLSALKKDQ